MERKTVAAKLMEFLIDETIKLKNLPDNEQIELLKKVEKTIHFGTIDKSYTNFILGPRYDQNKSLPITYYQLLDRLQGFDKDLIEKTTKPIDKIIKKHNLNVSSGSVIIYFTEIYKKNLRKYGNI